MSYFNNRANARINVKASSLALPIESTSKSFQSFEAVIDKPLQFDEIDKKKNHTFLWAFCYLTMAIESILILNYGDKSFLGGLVTLFVLWGTHSAFKQVSEIR